MDVFDFQFCMKVKGQQRSIEKLKILQEYRNSVK